MGRCFRSLLLAAAACALAACTRPPAAPTATRAAVFDVPRLTGITVDGKLDDWGERGFRVAVLYADGARKPTADFDAAVRLGWDERGLLAHIDVTDDAFVEHEREDRLWEGDSVELFVASEVGGPDTWQATIAPGLDPKHPEPRTRLWDYRKTEELKKVTLAASVARARTATGYVIEALLPWEGLAIQPAVGRDIGFQVYANDADGAGERTQLRWSPIAGAQFDTRKMQRLRLSADASPPVCASATGYYERFRRTRVHVAASQGARVRVAEAGRTLARGELAADGRLRVARLSLPMPARGTTYGPLAVFVDGQPVATLELPNADAERTRAFEREEVVFRPCVFSGEKFPAADFERPSLVEDLIGPYTLKATFYDAAYAEVTDAKRPGRYGAIVEVRQDDGTVTKRFLTLFRQPEPLRWWGLKLPLTVELPRQLGVEPAVAREQAETLADYLKWEMVGGFERSSDGAVILAGLHETTPGTPATDRTGPAARDTRWWHGLKKKTGDLVPLRYLVHLPPGAEADKAKRWPTILFLHGAGERGDDLKVVEVHGPPKLVKTRKDFPFIVISPQCPKGVWWSAPLLDDLLNEVADKYPIDPDRIYLTGLSMGGFGSWMLAMEHPDRFAAVVPICGGGDPRDAERIKDVPLWVFHGGKDSVVPVARSREMVDALTAVGGRVKLTVYPDAGHDSWTATYANEELYTWLLGQRRGRPQQPRATTERKGQ
ncbi:MAG TPA: sugar-binding protein [Planctomycetota bacterium]|nr:sugar-binding protein [Planctomycetota bacterium]